jgi:hypothetical protein
MKFLFSLLCFFSAATAIQIIPPAKLRDPTIMIGSNPQQRKSQYPLLSGETFRKMATHIFDETAIPFDPDTVRQGDTIFVAMPYLRFFLNEVMPQIQAQFIMITSNGSGTIDERYVHFLEATQLAAWFGRNITLIHPKIHLIPLGICWYNLPDARSYRKGIERMFSQLNVDSYFKPKKIHTYLNMSTRTHASRTPIQDYFRTQPYCLIRGGLKMNEYLSDLSQARFVLSPRGVNIDCFRTWEALYAGAIVVVESWGIDSLYEDLPVIIVEDLTQVTREFLDREFEKMKLRKYDLSKLHAEYWARQIFSVQKNNLN